jgi:hypothetical protein
MLLQITGGIALTVAVIGMANDNYVPLAIVTVLLILSLPLLDMTGHHPQRQHIRGWDKH